MNSETGLLKTLLFVALLILPGHFVYSEMIPIANASFEIPEIDPITNPFYAIPVIPMWTELDVDLEYSQNTGTFLNPEPNSPNNDHITNADGRQLVFIGSEQGNAILQVLQASYIPGKNYELTVAVGVSMRFPPTSPNTLKLSLYYLQDNDPNTIEIVSYSVSPETLSSSVLQDFSVALPAVKPEDPWAGRPIGIAIRSTGMPGGFWDIDAVRLDSETVSDFTFDHQVNLNDLAEMSVHWLACDTDTADMSGDRCINIQDLILWIDAWLHYEP